MRVGYGYDVHRLVEGRRLVLGGVEIEYPFGLQGHSDADVVLHAITDALLGAAALGDIGRHFPDSDARWKDADSRMFLAEAGRMIGAAGYRLSNIDVTIIAEKPRIEPHAGSMRSIIADLLAIQVSQVSVKATTSEGMGFVGEGLGIAAHAVCLLAEEQGGG
ncbi:MAG: 2-C-methyl-D-erythritol 2,4-cyclodiphosphate synthase [Rhodothermales bacterium]|nr:2-C-methyl-D-erythritol 2,4-cyclodiphosphate synthase [Rhodothermales bacterium]